MSTSQRPKPNRLRTRTARVVTREMVNAMSGAGSFDSLVVIYSAAPEEVTRRFVLDPSKPSYLLGRSSECDLVLESTAASRKHARVDHKDGAWWVVDLGSLNGTYVNDARVHAHKLAHGDRVQLGDTILKHLSGDDVEAAYVEAIRAVLVTDGLTQAANDRAFRDELNASISRAHNEGTPLSLIMADLDHFKSVNDSHGHPAGDRVLREFVRVVRACVPPELMVARVGGEEFAILAPGLALDAAREIAERARAVVAEHSFSTPAGLVRLTASFGVAQLGPAPESATQLFERADQKLYASKRSGRNRVLA